MTQAQEKRLSRRTGLRELIKSQIHELQQILDTGESEIALLTAHIEAMTTTQDQLCILDNQIQDHLDGDQFSLDIKESTDLKIKTDVCILRAKQRKSADETQSENISTNFERMSRERGSTPEPNLMSVPRPSELKLLSFGGDIVEFADFWSSFETSIDAQNYAPALKLRYLRQHTYGPARKLISGLPITDESYDKARTLLLNRFGKQPKLVEGLLGRLCHLKEPQYEYNSLFHFQSEITCLTEALKAHDVGNECRSCDHVMGAILTHKLPKKAREMLNWESPDSAWTLSILQRLLNRILRTMEADGERLSNETVKNYSRPGPSRTPYEDRQKTEKRPVSTILHASNPRSHASHPRARTPPLNSPHKRRRRNSNEKKPKCRFCEGPHHPSACNILPSSEVRKMVVQQRRWCLRCLSPQHGIRDCPSRIDCFRCKTSDHHVALCQKWDSPPNEDSRRLQGTSEGTQSTTYRSEESTSANYQSLSHQTQPRSTYQSTSYRSEQQPPAPYQTVARQTGTRPKTRSNHIREEPNSSPDDERDYGLPPPRPTTGSS